MSDNSIVPKLTIQNVFVREFEQSIAEDFQPALDNIEMLAQHKRGFGDGCIVNIAESEDEDTFVIYRFKYDCGVRFVLANTVEDDSPKVLYEIEATFVADYSSSENIEDKEAINDFGHRYVGYHVWPYWREFVQSSLQRSGLPTIVIPQYRVPNKPH